MVGCRTELVSGPHGRLALAPLLALLACTDGLSDAREASSGAEAYLLNAAGTTVADVPYLAETVGDGQSSGRLPNGTGSFAINTATPGKANQGP